MRHGAGTQLRLPRNARARFRPDTSSAGHVARRCRPKLRRSDVQYFGAMQMPGKARLIVVRGDEAMGEGLSYLLQATEHVAGREADQIPFPSDNWLSPRHAKLRLPG